MQSSWEEFLEACVRKRVSAEQFSLLVKTFQSKRSAPAGKDLVRILLSPKIALASEDPRIPLYVRQLLHLGACNAADVLSCLQPQDQAVDTYDQNLLEAGNQTTSIEAAIVQMLMTEVIGGLLKNTNEVQAILKALVPIVARYPSSVALGYLVSAILSSPLANATLTQLSTKSLRMSFGGYLSTLIAQVSQTDMQLATELDFWQKQYDIRDDIPGQDLELLSGVDLGALSFQESVLDSTPLNTRAGLYIYLNAMLYGRPIFDDLQVAEYLNTKYKGETAVMITDLILASFDILANAMYRTESTESITLLRSFLVNKLPVFLSNYATMIFEPSTMEDCISQALVRVDPAAFPSFMIDLLGRNGMLSEARQEFLFACALHQLIPEQSIEVLLGEVPMQSLPASGRYVKNDLVAQCSANPTKIEEFIGELENMEGNAGEIAAALIDIIHTLCSNNDTMTLKGVCNSLSRKPLALDVVMLFTQSNSLLQPLCHILDNWQDHEDQGEYQPVYDEFGSILLFIVLVQHRFRLQPHDLGINTPNSFVLKYTKDACMSRSPDDLTEHENKLLGGWIRGLFETEGINDEVMSMCRPNEFHLLVATLFDQNLKACQAKVLSLETLRGSFEYLLHPFLLPSLVAGLTWFAHKVWETTEKSKDVDITIPALHTLLKPPSIPSDSVSMHEAVLSIIAKPLEDSLSYAQSQHALRTDINPLLDTLKPHANKQRHEASFYSKLEAWSATPGGGLTAALRHTIQSLVLWSSASSADMSPPHYTHRQLIETLKILGAPHVLQLLLDEAITHSSSAEIDTVLDILVTMITAPQHQHQHQHPLPPPPAAAPASMTTLRDSLTAESARAFEISKSDVDRAAMVVRLHRRVAAFGDASGGDDVGIAGEEDALLHAAVVHNADGVPTADIDDVLVEADNQMAQEYLSGGSGAGFMGV